MISHLHSMLSILAIFEIFCMFVQRLILLCKTVILLQLLAKSSLQLQSIQFWSRFIPVNRGGWIYPTLAAISPTPPIHLAWLIGSSFSKPTLLLSFSTCVFPVFFGQPRFVLPFNSDSNAFLKTCPSSLFNTCSYHLTPFTKWTYFLLFNLIN